MDKRLSNLSFSASTSAMVSAFAVFLLFRFDVPFLFVLLAGSLGQVLTGYLLGRRDEYQRSLRGR